MNSYGGTTAAAIKKKIEQISVADIESYPNFYNYTSAYVSGEMKPVRQVHFLEDLQMDEDIEFFQTHEHPGTSLIDFHPIEGHVVAESNKESLSNSQDRDTKNELLMKEEQSLVRQTQQKLSFMGGSDSSKSTDAPCFQDKVDYYPPPLNLRRKHSYGQGIATGRIQKKESNSHTPRSRGDVGFEYEDFDLYPSEPGPGSGASISTDINNEGERRSTPRSSKHTDEERRLRRIVSNRKSAERTRERKKEHIHELEVQSQKIKEEILMMDTDRIRLEQYAAYLENHIQSRGTDEQRTQIMHYRDLFKEF